MGDFMHFLPDSLSFPVQLTYRRLAQGERAARGSRGEGSGANPVLNANNSVSSFANARHTRGRAFCEARLDI